MEQFAVPGFEHARSTWRRQWNHTVSTLMMKQIGTFAGDQLESRCCMAQPKVVVRAVALLSAKAKTVERHLVRDELVSICKSMTRQN